MRFPTRFVFIGVVAIFTALTMIACEETGGGTETTKANPPPTFTVESITPVSPRSTSTVASTTDISATPTISPEVLPTASTMVSVVPTATIIPIDQTAVALRTATVTAALATLVVAETIVAGRATEVARASLPTQSPVSATPTPLGMIRFITATPTLTPTPSALDRYLSETGLEIDDSLIDGLQRLATDGILSSGDLAWFNLAVSSEQEFGAAMASSPWIQDGVAGSNDHEFLARLKAYRPQIQLAAISISEYEASPAQEWAFNVFGTYLDDLTCPR